MDDFDAGLLGVGHRGLNLGERLLFIDPVENLLAAALDAEHERAAVRLGHRRKQVLRDGVNPAFTAPLNRDVIVVDAFADGLDPFGLQQKMVIHKIDRAVAQLLEVLELIHDMLRSSGSAISLR